MAGGHGSGKDGAAAAGEPAALDQIGSGDEFLVKFAQLQEIITVVAIAHEHEFAARVVYAAHEGIAVTLGLDVNDASAQTFGDLDGAIGAAVVGDDDFAVDAVFHEGPQGFADADRDGISLIKTGHDHA